MNLEPNDLKAWPLFVDFGSAAGLGEIEWFSEQLRHMRRYRGMPPAHSWEKYDVTLAERQSALFCASCTTGEQGTCDSKTVR
jgi:hypothetical protein